MQKYLGLIRKISLFASFTAEQIHSCLQDGSWRILQFARGNIIHLAGETCQGLEIILAGQVVVERIDEDGGLLAIAEFSAGDILGGNLMFSQKPFFPMTVTAKEAATVLAVPKDKLLQLLAQNQIFLESYLGYVADNTAILGDRLKHYIKRTIRESVTSYLTHESIRQESDLIQLPLSKKQLAEKLGVQRTSLSRELAKMRSDGLIRYSDRQIWLLPAFFKKPARSPL